MALDFFHQKSFRTLINFSNQVIYTFRVDFEIMTKPRFQDLSCFYYHTFEIG